MPPGIHRLAVVSASAILAALSGCATQLPDERSPAPELLAARERAQAAELEARVQRARVEQLEATVENLRLDIAAAGQTLIAIESGLRGEYTRADAVSELAEVRILMTRAAAATPWRPFEIATGHEKLEQADRHVRAGHFGSAMFFASSARRIGTSLIDEAERIGRQPGARFVSVERANLRAGPSTQADVLETLERGTPVVSDRTRDGWQQVRTLPGRVGWIHGDLLGPAHRAGAPASPESN